MLARIGSFAVRRRRVILVTSAVVFIAAGAFGGGVASHLSSGGFVDPSAESTKVQDLLKKQFHTGSPNVVLLVTARSASVDSPRVAAAGRALTARLAGEAGVRDAASYWSLGSPPPLRSADHRRALVVGRITGDSDEVTERIKELSPRYARSIDGAAVQVGGLAEVFRQVGSIIEKDLVLAESIALPITLLLLLFVFRGLVAALLPLAVGALTVVGTFVVLRLLSMVTEVSVFALNLTTAMGLGLAIDYSLFVGHGRIPRLLCL